MKHDHQHDYVRIQTQLNYFKFSADGDFGTLFALLRQFLRQPAGRLRALMDVRTLALLLAQPPDQWRETFGRCRAIRFYVYARCPDDLPTPEMLAGSLLAELEADVEVCGFESLDLACCLFYTDNQLLGLQDNNNGKMMGFAFPRDWSFVDDYTKMIERFAALAEPLLLYSNRLVRPPWPAAPSPN